MLRVLSLVLALMLAGCVVSPDYGYYDGRPGYTTDGGDYYYDRYERSYAGDYGYAPDYVLWPAYYSMLWPIYRSYYDPFWCPGYYYGVTYYPRHYFNFGVNYFGPSWYFHPYSPYYLSYWDNYYDWHGWRGGYGWNHHRDDHRDRFAGRYDPPRFGSARNEAERLARQLGDGATSYPNRYDGKPDYAASRGGAAAPTSNTLQRGGSRFDDPSASKSPNSERSSYVIRDRGEGASATPAPITRSRQPEIRRDGSVSSDRQAPSSDYRTTPRSRTVYSEPTRRSAPQSSGYEPRNRPHYDSAPQAVQRAPSQSQRYQTTPRQDYATPRAREPSSDRYYSPTQRSQSRPSYEAPPRSYAEPSRSYASPQRSYETPQRSYSAPQGSYSPPSRSASPPPSSYSAPSSSYSAPPRSESSRSDSDSGSRRGSEKDD